MLTKLRAREYNAAKAYFPEALPWIRSDMMDAKQMHNYVQSTQFDPLSIMIYSSDSNTVAEDKYVIWLKTGEPVWMGGSWDPAKAAISAGDIARVAQLYPSGTDEGNAAKAEDVWGQKQAVKVRIRNVFETMIYAPNRTTPSW